MAEPFLGVPKDMPIVENPDGVFRADGSHSLYDTGRLPIPSIPGDWDVNMQAGEHPAPSNDPYRPGPTGTK